MQPRLVKSLLACLHDRLEAAQRQVLLKFFAKRSDVRAQAWQIMPIRSFVRFVGAAVTAADAVAAITN